MKNSFADIIENVAGLQFESDQSLEEINGFIQRVLELEEISDEYRCELLSALDKIKLLIKDEVALKTRNAREK